jgi:hypothetical protein
MDFCAQQLMTGLLARFLDVRAVWRIGLDPEAAAPGAGHQVTMLVFADAPTLQRLHKSTPRIPGLDLLVVTDGDVFESAWGLRSAPGSLGRCAWRQTSANEAYYDESHWSGGADGGAVVRVRRKAVLVWRAADRQ